MILSDFNIGSYFYFNSNKYLCTDIGSRVVIAIKIFNNEYIEGPPYSKIEVVIDEMDIRECFINKNNYIKLNQYNIEYQ